MALDNALPSYESLLEFQEVYTRAVALSWEDPEFRAKFIANPLLTFQQYYAYICPWNIDFTVVPIEPHDKAKGWTNDLRTDNIPQSKITFSLANRPKEPKDVTLALAMYNDAGPTYMFSCC